MNETCESAGQSSSSSKKKTNSSPVNPATGDRHYTLAEVEFMNALAEFKRSSGRLFPSCSEILEILRNLGYEKVKEKE